MYRVRQIELDIQIDRESWREIYLEVYRVRQIQLDRDKQRWDYGYKDREMIELDCDRVRLIQRLVFRYMYIVVQIWRFRQIYVYRDGEIGVKSMGIQRLRFINGDTGDYIYIYI